MIFRNKISFCIVCMNRTIHLKQTLLKNIEQNLSYNNIEFVLLDYNSTDGLESWIKNNFTNYLNKGILRYFKTTKPQSFHRSHSRNVAMKLGTGDILCNLDADNFLGEDFAFFVNYNFNFKSDIFLTSGLNNGSYGKVCVRKNDFHKIRGYDEKMSGWGYEDNDLFYRLEKIGLKKEFFLNKEFTQFIDHPVESNFENDSEVINIKEVFICHVSLQKTIVLYIDGLEIQFNKNKKCLTNNELKFWLVRDEKLLNRVKILLTSLSNILVSESEISKNIFFKNGEIWGDVDFEKEY